jgi:hypothetical protein
MDWCVSPEPQCDMTQPRAPTLCEVSQCSGPKHRPHKVELKGPDGKMRSARSSHSFACEKPYDVSSRHWRHNRGCKPTVHHQKDSLLRWITPGLRQHSHSWSRGPTGSMILFFSWLSACYPDGRYISYDADQIENTT